MPSLIDCRHDALVGMFGPGHVNDLMILWLQANGATSPQLNDAWYEMLVAQGAIEPFQINDGWYGLLGGMGYIGAMNDRETAFWCEGGGVITPPIPADNVVFGPDNVVFGTDNVVFGG